MMRSVTGLQKGDPLESFLFSIILHELLTKLFQTISVAPKLLKFYIYDGVTIVNYETLRTIWNDFI